MPNTGEFLSRLRSVPVTAAGPASLLLKQMRDLGWNASATRHESIGMDGEPIPWWTYATSRWLDRALAVCPDCQVFEFGSGASTNWLAARAASITSVEHNPAWHDKVASNLPGNATLHLIATKATDADAEPDDLYVKPLTGTYDLIIIDGMGRNACARAAIGHVADAGLILLDDADRTAYAAGHQALTDAGFGRIDFFGPRPGVGHLSTTSLFCRDFNPWTRGLAAPEVSGY